MINILWKHGPQGSNFSHHLIHLKLQWPIFLLQLSCLSKQSFVSFLPCTAKLPGSLIVSDPLFRSFITARASYRGRWILWLIKQHWLIVWQTCWWVLKGLLFWRRILFWALYTRYSRTRTTKSTIWQFYRAINILLILSNTKRQRSINRPRLLKNNFPAILPRHQLLEFSHLVKEQLSMVALTPSRIYWPKAGWLVLQRALDKMLLAFWGGKVEDPCRTSKYQQLSPADQIPCTRTQHILIIPTQKHTSLVKIGNLFFWLW